MGEETVTYPLWICSALLVCELIILHARANLPLLARGASKHGLVLE